MLLITDPATWSYTGWIVFLVFGIGFFSGLISGYRIGLKR